MVTKLQQLKSSTPIEPASIYPVMTNTADVLAYAEHLLPINSINELHALLKLYENTSNRTKNKF